MSNKERDNRPRETPKRGEPIEIKVARLLSQEEPIKDQVPLIYTEKKTGVNPSHDIQTDS